MRFVHAADLHLDSPLRSVALRDPELGERLRLASRQVLTRIVDLAIDRQADVLVLAGDVFDSDEPDLAIRAHLVAELARLARADIPTVVIRGNHDALMDLARHGPLGKAVHLLDTASPSVTIRDVDFHGLSFDAPHVHESALPRYPAPTPGRRNVGVMHASLDGAAGHDPYGPCATCDLMAHGYDYWALGHIHRRSEARRDGVWVVMSGIPQGRHMREPGPGSVTLVTMGEEIKIEAISVARLAFETVSVNLAGLLDGASRADAVTEALVAAVSEDCDVALRVELSGDGAAAWADDPRTHLAPVVEPIIGVHLESVTLADMAPVETNPLTGGLARLMREEAAKPGFRDRAAGVVAELRRALPRELQTELEAVLSEGEIDALAADGMAGVMARLG